MRRLDALEPLLECDQIIAILAVIFGAVFIIGEFDGHRVVPLKSRRCYHSEGCEATRLTLIGRRLGEQRRDPRRVLHRDEMAVRVPQFRSEEHTSELQSLMRISYAVF